ncbi:hypothetical protein GCM10022393_08920 [Aquimarina addita]|uniref:Metal-dependent HD superfamily phosphohydrolase n=1 Tax=Aquimarina addita TaxID=870485 RepID=A0ABP7XC94_9FLAO
MLEKIHTELIFRYSKNPSEANVLWKEILENHTKKNRFYHTITHLENIYKHLVPIKSRIKDWDMILFAIFYHDFVYNILKKNNEEKSADKAAHILQSLDIENKRVSLCRQMIIATKGHQLSENDDINYFTDADLGILGEKWENYEIYIKAVRKEYSYYPDFLYNPGRIKVLNHFLKMPRIFKTDHFYNTLEGKAKQNLCIEIKMLSGSV